MVLNNILNECITPAKKRTIIRYSSNVSMKESGRGSRRIVEDLGKVLGGVLGKTSSGFKKIWGTKWNNHKKRNKFILDAISINLILTHDPP